MILLDFEALQNLPRQEILPIDQIHLYSDVGGHASDFTKSTSSMSSSSQSFALQPRVARRYEFYTPTLSEESLDTRDEASVFSPTQEQRVEIPRRRR